jgi:hypothetical protein
MLSSVCGIKPADIGFNMIKITPHLGNLNRVKADMPHPKGRIAVEYQKTKDGLKTRINLPAGLQGVFESNGVKKILTEGDNNFEL